MTEESVLLVRELKGKIYRLFGEFDKLEKRNQELHNEIDSFKERVRVLESENALLVTKYDHLKLARGMETGLGDSKMARQKVNKILREIDKCVALLNG